MTKVFDLARGPSGITAAKRVAMTLFIAVICSLNITFALDGPAQPAETPIIADDTGPPSNPMDYNTGPATETATLNLIDGNDAVSITKTDLRLYLDPGLDRYGGSEYLASNISTVNTATDGAYLRAFVSDLCTASAGTFIRDGLLPVDPGWNTSTFYLLVSPNTNVIGVATSGLLHGIDRHECLPSDLHPEYG